MTSQEPSELSYDAFVVYADADEAFVQGYFLPQLALPPERVLVRRRFALGRYELEEMERGVRSSRVTAIVLSSAGRTDPSAVVAQQMATYASVARSVRGALLPLVRDDSQHALYADIYVCLDFRDSVRQRWDSELDRLRRHLGNLSAAGATDHVAGPYRRSPTPQLDSDHDTIVKCYLDALISSYEFAPRAVRRRRERRDLRLDQLFVSLYGYPGSHREIRTRAEARTALGATFDTKAYERRKAPRAFAPPVHTAENLETVLDRDHRVALIQGDPGSGKSTLLHQIAVRCARTRRGDAAALLPIFLRAADFAAFSDGITGRPGTLVEFIGRQPLRFTPHYPKTASPRSLLPIENADLHRVLVRELTRTGGIVLIDGLDEVGDQKRRRRVAERCDELIDSLTGPEFKAVAVKILITSRRVGYEQAALSRDVVRYLIEPLEDGAIRKLVANWFVASCNTVAEGNAMAAQFIAKLFDPSNERIRAIAENPYLLTLLCGTYLDHRGLPRNRAELYHSVVDDNLLKLLEEREGATSPEICALIIRLIMRLAFHMHRTSGNGRIGAEALERELTDYLQHDDARGLRFDAVKRLIVEDAGLLVEQGADELGFAHRSLQEYLTGRQLLISGNTAATILVCSADPRWREPVLLALGYEGMSPRRESFEALLEGTLKVSSVEASSVPTAAMLLADAYFEIIDFPARIRARLLATLFAHYGSFLGDSAPFRRFVESFFARVWGSSPIDGKAELDVEDLLVAQLTGDDQRAAQRAAALIHERGIYSNAIAEALVSAQHHDGMEYQWAIHRALHVLVTRPAIEAAWPATPLPARVAEFDLPAASLEALRELNRNARLVAPPVEHRKLRHKVQQLVLSNLAFRSYLLQRPALCARIAASPSWCRHIAQLGIGGFGDFEAPELTKQRLRLRLSCSHKVGTAIERLVHAEALDTSLTPLVELANRQRPEFRADWIIRDPDDWHDLVQRLEADDATVAAPDAPAGIEPQIGRSLYLHADAFHRLDKISQTSGFSDEPLDEAHAWATRLFGGAWDRAYDVAVVLDTIGNKLASDPRRLVSSIGLACFSRPALAAGRGQLLWQARGLSDLFVFALGLLERLDNSFGFFHTWLLMQIRELLLPEGPLAAYLPEALIRVIDRRRTDPLLGDALLAAPEALRNLPVNELVAALAQQADALDSPYHRARAYIALHHCSPHQRPEVLIQAERLIPAIPDVLDRSIVLASLATVHPNAQRRAQHRRAALDEVGSLESQAPLFRMSLSQVDLVRFSDRLLPAASSTPPAPAIAGLVELREAWISHLAQYSMEAAGGSHRVWSALHDSPVDGWRLVLRHLHSDWLQLTPLDLAALRQLSHELRGRVLPYVRMLDEGLLSEFVTEMPELAAQMSLIAAENGRWSPQGIRDVVAYFASGKDALRLRAQQALALARYSVTCSQVGETTVVEAARLYSKDLREKALLWFLGGVLHDSSDAVRAWCTQLDDRHDAPLGLLVESISEFTEPVWRTMLDCLANGGPRSQIALLVAIRWTFESRIPAFCQGPALDHTLRQILARQPDDVVAMRIADLLGFMRGSGEDLLRGFTNGGCPAVRVAALVATGRRRLQPFDVADQLRNTDDASQRVAVCMAVIVSGGELPDDLVSDDELRRAYTRGWIAACYSLWINDAFWRGIANAASFIVARWDAGDDIPVHELLTVLDDQLASRELESYPMTDPTTSPARFAPLRLRDAVRVAAAVAELIPAAFAELAAARSERWTVQLARCSEHAISHLDRAAALRLLGALPAASTEAVRALVAGLSDDPFVAEAARDLCEHFPRPSDRAIRALFKLLGGTSPILVVAAARVLASACAVLEDEERRSVHDELIAALEQLLRSEAAPHPVVTLEGSAGYAYELNRASDLGSSLGEILFRLQGSRISEDDSRLRPRHAVARVRFAVQQPGARAARARIAIGELLPGDNSMSSQREVLQAESPSFDVLAAVVTLCKNQGYSIVELSRFIAEQDSAHEEVSL